MVVAPALHENALRFCCSLMRTRRSAGRTRSDSRALSASTRTVCRRALTRARVTSSRRHKTHCRRSMLTGSCCSPTPGQAALPRGHRRSRAVRALRTPGRQRAAASVVSQKFGDTERRRWQMPGKDAGGDAQQRCASPAPLAKGGEASGGTTPGAARGGSNGVQFLIHGTSACAGRRRAVTPPCSSANGRRCQACAPPRRAARECGLWGGLCPTAGRPAARTRCR